LSAGRNLPGWRTPSDVFARLSFSSRVGNSPFSRAENQLRMLHEHGRSANWIWNAPPFRCDFHGGHDRFLLHLNYPRLSPKRTCTRFSNGAKINRSASIPITTMTIMIATTCPTSGDAGEELIAFHFYICEPTVSFKSSFEVVLFGNDLTCAYCARRALIILSWSQDYVSVARGCGALFDLSSVRILGIFGLIGRVGCVL
jgi:hypothetical protein